MKSVIYGAGTYGQVYLTYLLEAGIDIIGFLDDDESLHNKVIEGIPVLGGREILKTLKSTNSVEAIYCPIGNNKFRTEILEYSRSLGYKTPNYIHPSVIVSPNVFIGEGVYILLGSCIMPYTVIKNDVMISMGVNVAHHSILDNGCFLSTGVNFGACIHACKYAYLGINSTIMTGVHELGEDCLIGAGAVVIKDVPVKAVVAGVPAKILYVKE